MIQRDYHGFTLLDAIIDVERHVYFIRETKDCKDMEFIVGNGVIKERVMKLLKDQYKLRPKLKLGNSGVICCYVE
jgi:hypothetical protein